PTRSCCTKRTHPPLHRSVGDPNHRCIPRSPTASGSKPTPPWKNGRSPSFHLPFVGGHSPVSSVYDPKRPSAHQKQGRGNHQCESRSPTLFRASPQLVIGFMADGLHQRIRIRHTRPGNNG